MAPLLEVKNLSTAAEKNGKNLYILNNISFSADEGEITGIAGESGCGKSMTALSITNLLPQNIEIKTGEVIYKKRDLTVLDETEMRSFRKEISIIFQDARQALNPLMKVGKQITETLELSQKQIPNAKNHITVIKKLRLSKKEIKIKNKILALELLDSLGFNNPEKIFEAFPHQLSGGMCQRIMTAIAVINNPKLLLADEMSSSLDEESQKKCLSALLEMNKNAKTALIIISHDLSIIKNFCRRFLIMYSGRIMEEGLCENLFSPAHPYTKALVNALPGKEKRGRNLENIPGKVPSIDDQLQGCPFAPRCSKARDICKETFPPDFFQNKNFKQRVYCYFPKDNL